MMKYVFERARNGKTGEHTERSLRRKGSVVNIESIELGKPLLAEYQDGSGTLQTSPVTVYNAEWREERSLIVQTKNNTVYVFRKEAE